MVVFCLICISPHFTTVIKIRHQCSREYIKHDYLRCLGIHNGHILTYFICDFLNVVISIELRVYAKTPTNYAEWTIYILFVLMLIQRLFTDIVLVIIAKIVFLFWGVPFIFVNITSTLNCDHVQMTMVDDNGRPLSHTP